MNKKFFMIYGLVHCSKNRSKSEERKVEKLLGEKRELRDFNEKTFLKIKEKDDLCFNVATDTSLDNIKKKERKIRQHKWGKTLFFTGFDFLQLHMAKNFSQEFIGKITQNNFKMSWNEVCGIQIIMLLVATFVMHCLRKI
jgi:hypothetical protein